MLIGRDIANQPEIFNRSSPPTTEALAPLRAVLQQDLSQLDEAVWEAAL